MASVKVILLLVTFCTLGLSLKMGTFRTFPVDLFVDLDDITKYCGDNNTNNEMYKEIVKEASDCYEEFFQNNSSLCHSVEADLQRCSQPGVDFFTDCLPEKSKYLPTAIVKTAQSFIEAVCTSSGEILLEASKSCLLEFIDHSNKTSEEECKSRNFESKIETFKDELPSKMELCEIARQANECWAESVNQECKSPKTRAFFKRFASAALTVCEEDTQRNM